MKYDKLVWKPIKFSESKIGVLQGYTTNLAEDALIDVQSLYPKISRLRRFWNWLTGRNKFTCASYKGFDIK